MWNGSLPLGLRAGSNPNLVKLLRKCMDEGYKTLNLSFLIKPLLLQLLIQPLDKKSLSPVRFCKSVRIIIIFLYLSSTTG